MHTNHERGIAIVLALLLMSAMSVLAASLMFLSQTETYASMNYRMMSQARYASEAGIQKAGGFLLDSAQYALPGTVADPIGNYDFTVSPVTYNGQPVVLSAVAAVPSNYPVPAVVTAFNNAAHGTVSAGNGTLLYGAYAKLLMMHTFISYGGGPDVLQTWEITGQGSFGGPRTAIVEVNATIETPKVPANSFAAFATADTCGAMYFHGNVTIDSYDSALGPYSGAGNSQSDWGGDVGTNGNLDIQGSVAVQGSLYTPRSGVGACTAGAVTGLTVVGSASLCADPLQDCVSVTESMVHLPKAVTYPPPTFSSTPPTTLVTLNATSMTALQAATTCTAMGLTLGTTCAIDPVAKTLTVSNATGADLTLPSVSVAGGYKLILNGHASPPQTININSLNGTGEVEVAANMASNLNEAVVLKVAGKNPTGVSGSYPDPTYMDVPFDLSQMTWKQNSGGHSFDAAAMQIVYGGPAAIRMKGGNSQSAASIYAPNASFELQGTQDLFGSILAKTVTNGGNASIHYDRRLSRDFYVRGQPMASTFNWKRY